MLGVAGKPPLRLHPVERELHALAVAAGRMANALERIAPSLDLVTRDIAAMRKLAERESR